MGFTVSAEPPYTLVDRVSVKDNIGSDVRNILENKNWEEYGINKLLWEDYTEVYYTGEKNFFGGEGTENRVLGKVMRFMTNSESVDVVGFWESLRYAVDAIGGYHYDPSETKPQSIFAIFRGDPEEGFESVEIKTPWKKGKANNMILAEKVANLLWRKGVLKVDNNFHLSPHEFLIRHPDDRMIHYPAGPEGGEKMREKYEKLSGEEDGKKFYLDKPYMEIERGPDPKLGLVR